MLLGLLLAVCSPVFAGSVVWVSEPDPGLTRGLVEVPVADVLPDPAWTEKDDEAFGRLVRTLEDVRPLLDEFDGELAIMSRLEAALAGIRILRDVGDRDVVYRALLFQGFAVQRYFQEQLATDPAAAPYRTVALGGAEVGPWVDAVALNGEAGLLEDYVPGPDEAKAFDALRAQVQASPKITVRFPEEGQVRIADGVRSASEALFSPGLHFFAVREGPNGVFWTVAERVRLVPGQDYSVERRVVRADFRTAEKVLAGGPKTLDVPPNVVRALNRLDAPVYVGTQTDRGATLYVLEQSTLRRISGAVSTGGSPSEGGLSISAAVGSGWMSNADWILLSEDPHLSTVPVNAPVVQASVSAMLPVGALSVGGGLDAFLPLGVGHALPVGVAQIRGHLYPFVSAGIRRAQLTVGALLPWRVGLGLRLTQPLPAGLLLTAGFVHGVGLDRTRAGVQPDFQPSDSDTAWLSVGTRWGG